MGQLLGSSRLHQKSADVPVHQDFSENPTFQPSHHQVTVAWTVLPSGHVYQLGNVLRIRTEGRKWTNEWAENSMLERLAEIPPYEFSRAGNPRSSTHTGGGPLTSGTWCCIVSQVCTPIQMHSRTDVPAHGYMALFSVFFCFQITLLGVAWKQVFLSAHLASSLSSQRPVEDSAHGSHGEGTAVQRHEGSGAFLFPFSSRVPGALHTSLCTVQLDYGEGGKEGNRDQPQVWIREVHSRGETHAPL